MQTTTEEEQTQVEAEYMLEAPVKCATCSERVNHLIVIRLLRTKVNFTSALPRRGYIVACPKCRATVSASVDR
jgi:hypothetical protein